MCGIATLAMVVSRIWISEAVIVPIASSIGLAQGSVATSRCAAGAAGAARRGFPVAGAALAMAA